MRVLLLLALAVAVLAQDTDNTATFVSGSWGYDTLVSIDASAANNWAGVNYTVAANNLASNSSAAGYSCTDYSSDCSTYLWYQVVAADYTTSGTWTLSTTTAGADFSAYLYDPHGSSWNSHSGAATGYVDSTSTTCTGVGSCAVNSWEVIDDPWYNYYDSTHTYGSDPARFCNASVTTSGAAWCPIGQWAVVVQIDAVVTGVDTANFLVSAILFWEQEGANNDYSYAGYAPGFPWVDGQWSTQVQAGGYWGHYYQTWLPEGAQSGDEKYTPAIRVPGASSTTTYAIASAPHGKTPAFDCYSHSTLNTVLDIAVFQAGTGGFGIDTGATGLPDYSAVTADCASAMGTNCAFLNTADGNTYSNSATQSNDALVYGVVVEAGYYQATESTYSAGTTSEGYCQIVSVCVGRDVSCGSTPFTASAGVAAPSLLALALVAIVAAFRF